MEVTCLEVYNETINDLFVGAAAGSAGGEPKKGFMSGGGLKTEKKSNKTGVRVRVLANGEIANTKSHVFGPGQKTELLAQMEEALQSRAVGRTNCNEASSRSHTVIQLKVSRTTEHGVEIEGELNLVDLAGSERIKNSGVSVVFACFFACFLRVFQCFVFQSKFHGLLRQLQCFY